MLNARSPPVPNRLTELRDEEVGDVYISFTVMDEEAESGAGEPLKNLRPGLSQEGTPTFHKLVDSLLNEKKLGSGVKLEVEGGYVCSAMGNEFEEGLSLRSMGSGEANTVARVGDLGAEVTGMKEEPPRWETYV